MDRIPRKLKKKKLPNGKMVKLNFKNLESLVINPYVSTKKKKNTTGAKWFGLTIESSDRVFLGDKEIQAISHSAIKAISKKQALKLAKQKYKNKKVYIVHTLDEVYNKDPKLVSIDTERIIRFKVSSGGNIYLARVQGNKIYDGLDYKLYNKIKYHMFHGHVDPSTIKILSVKDSHIPNEKDTPNDLLNLKRNLELITDTIINYNGKTKKKRIVYPQKGYVMSLKSNTVYRTDKSRSETISESRPERFLIVNKAKWKKFRRDSKIWNGCFKARKPENNYKSTKGIPKPPNKKLQRVPLFNDYAVFLTVTRNRYNHDENGKKILNFSHTTHEWFPRKHKYKTIWTIQNTSAYNRYLKLTADNKVKQMKIEAKLAKIHDKLNNKK